MICFICAQRVAKSNQAVHEANCSREQRRRMASKPSARAPAKAEARKAPKPKSMADTLAGIDADDEDALLDAAVAARQQCAFGKCKASIALLHTDCSHCGNIYCLSHGMPEV